MPFFFTVMHNEEPFSNGTVNACQPGRSRMFVPNRFLTIKEEILLLGVMGAVLLGIGTLWLYRTDKEPSAGETPETAYRRIVPPTPDRTEVRLPVPGSVPGPAAARDASQRTVAGTPPAPRTEGTAKAVPEREEVLPAVAANAKDAGMIGVAAMGAVCRPGFYRMRAGDRITDLIEAAGGAAETADLSGLLPTAQLIDGATLTVPFQSYWEGDARSAAVRRPETDHRLNPDAYLRKPLGRTGNASTKENSTVQHPPAAAQKSGNASAGEKININTASAIELQQLPGIGAVLSSAIVAEREKGSFTSPEDLLRVPGIGEKRLEAVRSLITAP